MKRDVGRRTISGTQWRMRWLGGASALAAAMAMTPAVYAQEQTLKFDIASQPLSAALLAFGRQAHLSVLAPSEFVDGKTAPAVQGDLSTRAALERLLAGSGLKYEFVQTNAVRIVRADQASLTPERVPTGRIDEVLREPERVIVTGTNIRGVSPDSSPIQVYTAKDIARTGATTTEQFIAKLPQNLGTYSQYAAGSLLTATNLDAVTSVDLRGLGVGTTLTLLNGHRMALSSSGQSADVSLIPASAIARVEVLTDGASAIYGSDAIGGVVNFVLRDDFEGAETDLSYGGTTSGGLRQGDASQTFGHSWGSGHGLISYSYHSASALQVADRDYAAPAGRGTLTPDETRHNFLATVEQSLSDRLSLNVDLGYGSRDVKDEHSFLTIPVPIVQSFQTYRSDTNDYFGDAALDYRISDFLTAEFSVSYSKVAVDGFNTALFFNRVPQRTTTLDYSTEDRSLDLMGKLQGVLLTLPGGKIRFSVGGGLLEEKFRGVNPIFLVQSAGTIGRKSPYAFGELFVPLIGADQNVPFVHRLELSLAARYTDYQDASSPRLDRDFGDSTDPKVGLLWAPVEPLNFRATYGTSFRAPSLTQLDPSNGSHLLQTLVVAGNPATVLTMSGYGVPNLGPETATTYTAGFDYKSAHLPGFRFSGTYYNVDYKDRIGLAPSGGLDVFANPLLLPDLIYRAPSADFIEAQLRASSLALNSTGIDLSDPHAAAATLFELPDFWISDGRYKNLALSKQDGFDLDVSQSVLLPWGEARFGGTVTHILQYKQRASTTSTVLTAVDIPGSPASWRGRAYAGLSAGGLDGSISLNYTGSYVNPYVVGPPKVDSWTTFDINLAYDFGKRKSGDVNGPRISLSVQNLFDQDPPLLARGSGGPLATSIGFDPANANPLGRLLVVGLSHKW